MTFKVLTVDHTPTFRKLIRMTLEFGGHKVLEADNGRRGLDLARESACDLILLELRLPDIHGLEVCRELLSNKITEHIPIVVLSNSENSDELEACIQLGVKAYVMKPFSPRYFLDVVLQAIDGSRVGTARLKNSLPATKSLARCPAESVNPPW
jgi:CheY-like chemotaxis protein